MTNGYLDTPYVPAGIVARSGQANGQIDRYIHPDWLGSGRVKSGTTAPTFGGSQAFAPFGETYSVLNGFDTRFAGMRPDMGGTSNTGLSDTPNRELYRTQARWISPDPAGLGAVSMTNPQTWNRYAYVMNNPLNAIDSLGLGPNDDCIGCQQGDFFLSQLDASNQTIDFSFNSFGRFTNFQTFGENAYSLPGYANETQEALGTYFGSIYASKVRLGGNGQWQLWQEIPFRKSNCPTDFCTGTQGHWVNLQDSIVSDSSDWIHPIGYYAQQTRQTPVASTGRRPPTDGEIEAACTYYAIINNNGFDVGASKTASLANGTVFKQHTKYARPTVMNPSSSNINVANALAAPGIYVRADYVNCADAFNVALH